MEDEGLVIELLLDQQKYLQALARTETQTSQSAQRISKFLTFDAILGPGFGNIAKQLSVVSDVVQAGAQKLMHYSEEMVSMSNKTGIGIEALESLKFAAEQSNTSMGAVQMGWRRMTGAINEGSKGTRAAVKDLGLSFEALKSATPEKQLDMVFEAMSKLPSEAQKTQAAMAMFGPRIGPELKNLAANASALKAEFKELGIGIGESGVKAAASMKDQFAKLEAVKDSLKMKLGDIFTSSPAVKAFLDWLVSRLAELSRYIDKHKVEIQEGLSKAWAVFQKVVDEYFTPAVQKLIEGGSKVISRVAEIADTFFDLNDKVQIAVLSIGVFTKLALAGQLNGWADSIKGVSLAVAGLKAEIVALGLPATVAGVSALAFAFGALAAAIWAVPKISEALDHVAAIYDAGNNAVAAATNIENMRKYKIVLDDLRKMDSKDAERLPKQLNDLWKMLHAQGEKTVAVVKRLTESEIEAARVARETAMDRKNNYADDVKAWEMQIVAYRTLAAARNELLGSPRIATGLAPLNPFGNTFEEQAEVARRAVERYGIAVKAVKDAIDDLAEKNRPETIMSGGFMQNLPRVREDANGIKAELKEVHKVTIDWARSLQVVSQLFDLIGVSADSKARKLVGIAQSFQAAAKQQQEGDYIGAASSAIAAWAGVIDFFKTPAWKKMGREAGKFLGVEISDALAQELDAQAKKLKLNVSQVSLLNLAKIAADSGQSIRGMAGNIADLMARVASGALPAAEGVKAIGEAWAAVRAEAEKYEIVGDRTTVMMLKMARATDSMTKEMKAFVKEQVALAQAGGGKIAEGLSALFGAKDGAGKDALAALGADSAALFMASFNAAVAEFGWVEAVDKMKEGYKKLLEALGGDADATALLGPFAQFSAYLENEVVRALVTVSDGVKDVLTGLANAGYLSVEQFRAAENILSTTVQKLRAEGVLTKDALLAIAPALAAAISAAQQYGIPLDEKTAELKAAAEAAGIKFPIDPLLQVRDILISIAEALGATIPESARAGAEATARAAEGAGESQRRAAEAGADAHKTAAAAGSGAWTKAFADTGVMVGRVLDGLVDSFRDVTTGVDDLAVSIWDSTDAALSLADAINGIQNKTITIDVNRKWTEQNGGYEPIIAAAGFYSASMPRGPLADGGTPMIVHPNEEVIVRPAGGVQGRPPSDDGGSSSPILVQLVVDGSVLAEAMARQVDGGSRGGRRLKTAMDGRVL